ncbi:MAG TPA: efflux RND transporter permease subunit, partial [Terriglobales bacterium]|nr:efflux RND transporter permease subunit [Terriglobales bacterium]
MRIWQLCIERPVLATVLSLVITLFGAIAFTRLQNRLYPDVDPPMVSVTAVLPGAAPEVIETSVTQLLEDQLIAIDGVKHVTSLSREQVAQITVEFELGRDVDAAANDVRDRVARVRNQLPDDIEEPIVAKRDADAFPILWLAMYSDRHSQLELSTLAETSIQDRLGKLPGVSEVMIAGERRYSMRIWLDNSRLTAHYLVVGDVAAALARENVDIPSGRVEGLQREFTVRTLGELKSPEDFGALVISEVNGQPVYLRDVATVEVGAEDDRKIVRFNGRPAVGLGVVKQSKANTLEVSRAIKEEIEALRSSLPAGVKIDNAFDTSIFIERSLRDVGQTILEAVVLVVAVIFLFLRNIRATIIPAVAIPVSLIGTFFVLYMLNFSINTLTLMGMTLAIGLVVDDAIVVLENVSRWVEQGVSPFEAARRGMDEIAFAVIAATVATVAVFLPLAYLTDTTGLLFREFGLTVAASVAISGFVALTLSPMLCARILRHSGEERGLKLALARGFDRMADAYGSLLERALRFRGTVLLIGLIWVGLGVFLLRIIPSEFIPMEDRGSLLAFTRAPEGSTIEYTDTYQRQIEEIVARVPEIDRAFSVVALGLGTPGQVNEGAMFASMKPWEERERTQMEIVDQLRGEMWQVAGIQAFPSGLPPLGQAGDSSPVSLVVQGPDITELAKYTDQIVAQARAIPGLVNVRSDLFMNKPQMEVEIDRERASDVGASVRDIATTLQILFGGLDLSTFKQRGETYKVIAQLDREERSTARDLYGVFVRGRDDPLIPLGSVVRVRETVSPQGVPHYDRLRSATISGYLMQGASLGTALSEITRIAEETLPSTAGYRVTYSGESESFFESGNALAFAYVLAVVIIYLVLA